MVHTDQCADGDYTEAGWLHRASRLLWTMEDYAIAESKNNGIETHGGAVLSPSGSSDKESEAIFGNRNR